MVGESSAVEVLAEIPRHSGAEVGGGGVDDVEMWLRPFTLEHGVTVLAWAVAMTLLVWWGWRLRRGDEACGRLLGGGGGGGGGDDTVGVPDRSLTVAARSEGEGGAGRELRYRRVVGWGMLVFVVLYQLFWLTPPRLDLSESLPLQMCDITGMLAPIAMLMGVRAAWTLVYFWGLGLSSQAFVTPVEGASPAEPHYWVFWGMHSIIVVVAVYGVVVAGYRPVLRDLLLAIVLGVVYITAMFVLNAATGWNYGYVGPTEPQPGVVALLGGYPLRALFVSLIGIAAVCVWYLPWLVLGKSDWVGLASRS